MIGIEDGERFFEIVQTTPDLVEADQLVRAAMARIVEQMKGAIESKDNLRQCELGAVKRRVQAELHRIQTIRNEVAWQDAVKAVCGPELYAQCVEWIVRNKQELIDGRSS